LAKGFVPLSVDNGDDHIDVVKRFRTEATNGPIVHPPGDM
jgi:hypothetical protein